jgi:hypothetical protein
VLKFSRRSKPVYLELRSLCVARALHLGRPPNVHRAAQGWSSLDEVCVGPWSGPCPLPAHASPQAASGPEALPLASGLLSSRTAR